MLQQSKVTVRGFTSPSALRRGRSEASRGLQAELLAPLEAESYLEALIACKDQHFLVFSIDSDVCFYPDEQERLMEVLKLAGVPARRITVHSDKGHDSFLLEPQLFAPYLRQTLEQPWGSA